ncbi:hypothetical protein KBY96_07890 [Cyanobium sp. ATX 6A2]|uniref:hypothetical protein n=1 Tax=Cyanobium sp. ATX 6A2 TaxID=2823700 RepID=UPI0020CF7AF7|nr:hypothetical protein [Cyanobium sp. ATX 6A2]MCP9887851.1 hypothetical protein [Cyanobium sp. ATX 6A2]
MTSSPATPAPLEPLEALDVLPLPADAIRLADQGSASSSDSQLTAEQDLRRLGVAALRQAMAERQLDLPIGPQTDLLDPDRLLALNRFAVQLLTTGLLSEAVDVPLAPWRQAGRAPQLLVVAAIDDESAVVHIAGVLTGPEFIRAVSAETPVDPAADHLSLPLSALPGDIERLFNLVALLHPAAIPRDGLAPADQSSQLVPSAELVLDWLTGLLSPALEQLGGQLRPVTAGAFRAATAQAGAPIPNALAVLAIPLGLTASGELVSGEAAQGCVERFELRLIPTAAPPSAARSLVAAQPRSEPTAERLTLQLLGDLDGDLLPDGLVLEAVQGSRRLSVTTEDSTLLELVLPAADQLIEVTLTPPSGPALVLPPLQLPAG